MPSRNRFLSSHGLWLMLAVATACIDAQEETKATEPPPIVGMGTRRSAAQAQPAGSGSTTNSDPGTRTQTMTMTATPAATGGTTAAPDAAESELDAGPSMADSGTAGTGTAGTGGRGGSSGAAAGSGGRGGAGGMSGASGQSGQAGSAGGTPSEACTDQLCFTLVDCWLLSVEDCGYVACDNFVCR